METILQQYLKGGGASTPDGKSALDQILRSMPEGELLQIATKLNINIDSPLGNAQNTPETVKSEKEIAPARPIAEHRSPSRRAVFGDEDDYSTPPKHRSVYGAQYISHLSDIVDNQTIDEEKEAEKKKKLEMRRILDEQVKENERRKREEKERIRLEDLEEEQRIKQDIKRMNHEFKDEREKGLMKIEVGGSGPKGPFGDTSPPKRRAQPPQRRPVEQPKAIPKAKPVKPLEPADPVESADVFQTPMIRKTPEGNRPMGRRDSFKTPQSPPNSTEISSERLEKVFQDFQRAVTILEDNSKQKDGHMEKLYEILKQEKAELEQSGRKSNFKREEENILKPKIHPSSTQVAQVEKLLNSKTKRIYDEEFVRIRQEHSKKPPRPTKGRYSGLKAGADDMLIPLEVSSPSFFSAGANNVSSNNSNTNM